MKIHTDGKKLVDESGHHIIFNGINLVCKEKTSGYLGDYDERLFKKLSEWGFNLVRLGIIWDGIEPHPLQYDDNYINEIRKYMDMCYANDIYVILDMHQDLFSEKYSDGAPNWATLDESKPHVIGDIWSDSYLLSPAVQTAFDNFWINSKTSSGIGLQDHFSMSWMHILKILGDHPALIGYDFLNEPFPGTLATDIYGAMFYSFGQVLGKVTGIEMGPEDVASVFNDPIEMAKALTIMNDYNLYRMAVEPVGELIKDFDTGPLNNFYSKLTHEVRKNGYKGLILQENNYFSNAGVPSQIEKIQNDSSDDNNQAYSPHGYDLVVDTEGVGALSSNDRVDVIFDNHKVAQDLLNVPVIVGEWGAFAHYNDTLDQCEHIIRIFEKNLWSNTYWCYHENFESVPVLSLLKRGYPMAVVGEIISYEYDYVANKLHIVWNEGDNSNGFSEFYIPHTIENSNYKFKNSKESCIIKVEAIGGVRELTL